jgi:hemerythrin-like domain-containing protein
VENATRDEKEYLPIIRRRIELGNLSEILRERVEEKSRGTDFKEAIIEVYSELAQSLERNRPYF